MGSITGPQMAFIITFLAEHPELTVVLETGFHKGLSSAVFLDQRPDIRVVSFDIFWFDYTRKAKLFLDKHYPDRHLLLAGNSVTSLPTFFKFHPEFVPDFVFIDGGHERPVPYMDIYQVLSNIKENTWVMIDDYCKAHGEGGVNEAVDYAVKLGLLKDVKVYAAADRGWITAQRSEVPMPPCMLNDEQRHQLLEDVISHYT
jgi:predicted O-methyltransferase YrrM